MAIGIGLIGAGTMGSDHAAILSTAVSGAELVAVSDPEAGRVGALVDRWPSVRPWADPLALIRDPRVGAVIVATPDETHVEFTLACLRRGIAVLCEKPLAPSPEECLRVVEEEVALRRRLVTVGYMRRFDPGYVEMKRRLDARELGEALLMHCVHRNAVAPSYSTTPMLIANSAVHEFDIARHLLGREVRRIRVVSPRKSGLATFHDPQLILLEMEGGVIVDAEIFLNAQYGYDVRAELVCERGAVALSAPHDVTVKTSALEGFGFPGDWRPRFAAAYRAELQAWVKGLPGKEPVGASAWDGYAAAAVAAAGLRSLETGQAAEVLMVPRPALYS